MSDMVSESHPYISSNILFIYMAVPVFISLIATPRGRLSITVLINSFFSFISFSAVFLAIFIFPALAQNYENTHQDDPDKLVVLWISDDSYVAEKVAFMYTHAAKKAGWFKEVTLVIWGPSAKLISENSSLQKKISNMVNDGVEVQACVVCANSYGVTDKLKELGYEVKGMGKPLTDYLKSGAKVLTF